MGVIFYRQAGPRPNGIGMIRMLLSFGVSCTRTASHAMIAAATSAAIGTAHVTPVHAASDEATAVLQSLVGRDERTVEHRLGPPDHVERNGVQTFLRYRGFDSWRTGSKPDPFGYSQGYSGGTGFRTTASFNCVTVLALVDGTVRSFHRSGIGCR